MLIVTQLYHTGGRVAPTRKKGVLLFGTSVLFQLNEFGGVIIPMVLQIHNIMVLQRTEPIETVVA
jgi:hypothetical protein